jgi:pimeloyl-ACP methyl ester carboxylesterase
LSPERRRLILDNDFRALAALQQDHPSQVDELARMTMPCFIYVGGTDVVREKAEQAAAELPNSHLAIIGDLEHGAVFMNSGQFVPVVLQFLRTI